MTPWDDSMSKLYHVIYVSSTKAILSEQALSAYLESFRANNHKHGITGLLLYKDGNVMQVIEGEQEAIEQLLNNIKTDGRHSGIIVLVKEEIATREFSEWSMSFRNLSGIKTDGFSEFLSVGLTPGEDASLIGKAKTLLLNFRG
jgi:hypothetical protein